MTIKKKQNIHKQMWHFLQYLDIYLAIKNYNYDDKILIIFLIIKYHIHFYKIYLVNYKKNKIDDIFLGNKILFHQNFIYNKNLF